MMVAARELLIRKIVAECFDGREGSVLLTGRAGLVRKPAGLDTGRLLSIVIYESMLVRGLGLRLFPTDKILDPIGEIFHRQLVASN
jgi:hypothetical protein